MPEFCRIFILFPGGSYDLYRYLFARQLKQISLAWNNTDKIDGDKLCQAVKAQVLSGVQQIVPVTLPSEQIQELRSLFSPYRLYRKQNTQLKNCIPSLVKEQLHGFTHEDIFDKKSRQKIRGILEKPVLRFQINQVMDRLEWEEEDVEAIKEQVLATAKPFMPRVLQQSTDRRSHPQRRYTYRNICIWKISPAHCL